MNSLVLTLHVFLIERTCATFAGRFWQLVSVALRLKLQGCAKTNRRYSAEASLLMPQAGVRPVRPSTGTSSFTHPNQLTRISPERKN